VGGEVAGAHRPAGPLDVLGHPGGQAPGVHRRRAFAGQVPQRRGQLGRPHRHAGRGGNTAGEVHRARLQPIGGPPPPLGGARPNLHPLLRAADGRLQQTGPRQCAEPLVERGPPRDRARHGRAPRATGWHPVDPERPDGVGGHRRRGPAGGVEHQRPAGAGRPVQRHQVAADPVRARLRHGQRRRDGHRGVGGGAARGQHVHPDPGGHRLGGGHHAARPRDRKLGGPVRRRSGGLKEHGRPAPGGGPPRRAAGAVPPSRGTGAEGRTPAGRARGRRPP